ncbi:MAG TPA: GAF domain-containing protein [Chloroflexi bacterium]|nr:GAF domain-containing protein [Chloroflexota bacterium]
MMNTTQNKQAEQTTIARLTYAAIAAVVLSGVLAVAFGFLFIQTDLWQWLSGAIIAASISLAGLNAWRITRSGRVALAGNWLVGGITIPAILFNLFVEDAVLVFVFLVVFSPLAVWRILYQSKKWKQSLLIGGVTGLCIVLVDLLTPFSRISTEPSFYLTLMAWVVAVFLGLISLYFASRIFLRQSIRIKLIISFLLVSVFSGGSIALVNSYTAGIVLADEAGAKLKSIANARALAVGGLLVQQVDLLQALGLNQILQYRIDNANTEYSGGPAEIQAEIEALDRQWLAESDADPLVYSRLNNPLASELLKFQETFPAYVEILATDRYGALIAATNRTSDYYQADEAWWQETFNNGQGSIYIGSPSLSESSQRLVLAMAIPVYAAHSRDVIGVLHTTYDLTALAGLLPKTGFGQTGRFDIYIGGGWQLAWKDGEFAFTPADIDPSTLVRLNSENYVDAPYHPGTPSFISQSPVEAITGEEFIGDLNWTLIAYLDRAEALAPVRTQQLNNLLLALLIIGLTFVAAVGMGRLLTGPIIRLTGVAGQVSAGDLTVQAQVESNDEVGSLAVAFNTMTGRIRENIGDLEKYARQIETVVDVSHRLTAILDLSDLLHQVVNLIKETFGYYHVHIYLLEDETLLMAEGYGQAGAEMKRQEHNIPLTAPRSLVARAAREGQIITVENVRDDPDWLPNPLLPETHSEMAVPVILGGKTVGVLDVQSEKVGGLSATDEDALRPLADQVASAVRNARAFAQAQDALNEAQELQRLYTSEAWEQFSVVHPTTDYEVRQPTLLPLQEISTPEAAAALQRKQTVDLRMDGNGSAGAADRASSPEDAAPEEAQDPDGNIENALATPLRLGDQIIGVLGIRDDNPERRWTKDEITLIEAVSEQMSLAIENARLFDNTRQRAAREKTVADMTQQVWSSDRLEEVMQTAVEQLGSKLNASKVIVQLGTKDELLSK